MIYIKNEGSTKSLIRNNRKKHIEELKWNANYDGKQAQIRIKTNNDGEKHRYKYRLDNDDLVEMLNMNSHDMPLHKRLENDFRRESCNAAPLIYKVELSEVDPSSSKFLNLLDPSTTRTSDDSDYSSSMTPSSLSSFTPSSIMTSDDSDYISTPTSRDNISIEPFNLSSRNYMSSPLLNEEYIIPESRMYQRYTFTPRKRNLTLKPYKSYRAYKKRKKTSRPRYKKRTYKKKTYRRKSSRHRKRRKTYKKTY
jgi:hypothetical protein